MVITILIIESVLLSFNLPSHRWQYLLPTWESTKATILLHIVLDTAGTLLSHLAS